jgi:hypothetical protein
MALALSVARLTGQAHDTAESAARTRRAAAPDDSITTA